jgi:RNA polymerase sigma-70 factor, ECF subfamily
LLRWKNVLYSILVMASLIQDKPSDTQSHEKGLVQRAILQDKEAYAELYDLNVDRVFRHVYYRVCSKTDTEDIAQEVFVRGWKAIGNYKDRGAPFGAWLFAIADNLIADYFRKRKNKTVPLEEAEEVQDTACDPVEAAEASIADSATRAAIWKLTGEKQKVILLRFIAGYDSSEIAKLLKKSEGAIRVIQFRALKDLRHLLQKERKENEKD